MYVVLGLLVLFMLIYGTNFRQWVHGTPNPTFFERKG